MGTRHRQMVISKSGDIKIDQYGQWDGNPEGQGIGILEYLRSGNLEKYQENINNINEITKDQGEKVDKDPNWSKNYPYLSRDCGSDIHQMIEDGDVKFVSLIGEKESYSWCEGFYTVDFQKNLFTSSFHEGESEFKLSELPTNEEYLLKMKLDDDDDDSED